MEFYFTVNKQVILFFHQNTTKSIDIIYLFIYLLNFKY
jgi:hypothetical protein